MNLELKIINGFDALEQISKDWTELTDKMEKKRFFHQIEYYKAYMDTLEKNPDSIYFFILHDSEKVIAIFPFHKIIWHFGPINIRMLESIKHEDPQLVDFQYDFVMQTKGNSASIFQALLDNLKKYPEMQWDLICIHNVLDDSYAASALNSVSSIKIQCLFSLKCYYISTDSYDRIIRNTSSNFRRSLKRARKSLSDIGLSSFASINEFSGLKTAYTDFLNMEGSGWKQQRGTAIIQHDNAKNYYLSMISYFSNLNSCEIHELKLEDETIASFFSITDDRATYLPKIGYNEQFDEVSPGKLLFDYLIKRCCDNDQTKELIFLSNASHLEHWRPEHYTQLNYFLFNNNIQGNIGYIFKVIIDYIRPYLPYLKPYYRFFRINGLGKLIYILK